MTPVRLLFSDIPAGILTAQLPRFLQAHYQVGIVENDPDYVIYSVFGSRYLAYPDSVRIFMPGENVRPDFNLCDYAFGYDWMKYGDRYFRLPNYFFYPQFTDLRLRLRSPLSPPSLSQSRDRFCNFVYTNAETHPFRDVFFRKLCTYKRVDSAGAHLNNMGRVLPEAYKGDWSAPKVAFQRQYKFSVAFENSSTPGYTTEKIVHALSADTIPIYWGNPEIGREFNPERIINCHEFKDVDAIIQRVAAIDNDDRLFRGMLEQPFFPDGRVPQGLNDEDVLGQFHHILRQPKQAAFRRNPYVWGEKYEVQRREEANAAAFLSARGLGSRVARILFRGYLRRRRSLRLRSVSR